MKRISIIGAVALGVTLVWACSSAVEDLILTPDASAGDSVSTSGERLQIRPIVYEGDDGSVIRMGEEIFDTELGVVCEPALAADGVLRCLPSAPAYFGGFKYADPACTTPVLLSYAFCNDGFARVYVDGHRLCPDNSGPIFEVAQASEPYEGPTYDLLDGDCIQGSDTSTGYALVEVIPPTSFPSLSRAE